MSSDFALNDLTLLTGMYELDRILKTDDVEITCFVQMIDHRCERRRLTGTSRSGDKNHTLMDVTEFFQDFRDVQLVQSRDIAGNVPKYSADAGSLTEDIDPKTSAFFAYVGEIQVVALLQIIFLRRR